uniref:Uncharacterized protein n=1 Tax=Setaria italica TaxID=4555 RepID=K3XNK2_SETIT
MSRHATDAVSAGADWSLQNKQGWSALQEAICWRGRAEEYSSYTQILIKLSDDGCYCYLENTNRGENMKKELQHPTGRKDDGKGIRRLQGPTHYTGLV